MSTAMHDEVKSLLVSIILFNVRNKATYKVMLEGLKTQELQRARYERCYQAYEKMFGDSGFLGVFGREEGIIEQLDEYEEQINSLSDAALIPIRDRLWKTVDKIKSYAAAFTRDTDLSESSKEEDKPREITISAGPPSPGPIGQALRRADREITKFFARNFFGMTPTDHVLTMSGELIPMSDFGVWSNRDKSTDFTFFAVSSMVSVFQLAKAANGIKAVSTMNTVQNKLDDVVESANKVQKQIEIIDGKVGGKVPIDDYNTIRKISVKNPDSDSLTLGRYRPTMEDGVPNWLKPGHDSYNIRAGETSYFDLGTEYSIIQERYGLSDSDMFNYFNKPVLDDAFVKNQIIRFSHDPREVRTGALFQEWEYIKSNLGVTDVDLVPEGGFWYVK